MERSRRYETPTSSPPPFDWDAWYKGVGGRTISVAEVDRMMDEIFRNQVPRFTGPVAEEQRTFESPESAADFVKVAAGDAGADIVGICEIGPEDVYRGRDIPERYAIAVGARMSWKEFQEVPSVASAIECMRVYHSLGETVIRLAETIREIGWACRVEHPLGDSDLMHIPIGLKAGLGELGRHGSIINPKLGPLFRMGSVITSMPLATDSPIDVGIAEFCDRCRACRRFCPVDAIPDERSSEHGVDPIGKQRYVVDTGRCFPYFARNYYCSICLPVCAYNHKEWARDFNGAETTLFPVILPGEETATFDGVDPGRRHDYPQRDRDQDTASTP